MLPRVKIYFENGTLGSVTSSDDSVTGLLASGVAVTGKFVLGTAYSITKPDGLTALGITADPADVNAVIYKAVTDFYTEAPEGTKLWILAAANTVTAAQLVDKDLTHAPALINAANGAINMIMVAKGEPVGYTPTITTGIDADILAALIKAQALCEWSTVSKYAPCFALLEGRRYAGTASALPELASGTQNRVGIVIGDTVSGSNSASVGTIAGRYAAIPVQRSAARVKTGVLKAGAFFIGAKAAELADNDVISDKGFITFRTFTGKSGYYVTDDKLATASSDDYALVPRRRTIDKAYRIAYKTLVEELGDEIPVTDDGYIPAPICKSIQNKVETAIENGMPGNLGIDPSNPLDNGVECYIDYQQKVVSTEQLQVKLRIKPFGYPKYIDLYLGFKTVTA